MTEQEWLECADPATMLRLWQGSGKMHSRKVRLFGAACCRLVWHLLPDARSRRAVEVAELFADGLATQQEAEAARNAADAVSGDDTPGGLAVGAAALLLPQRRHDEGFPLAVWELVALAIGREQLAKEGAAPADIEAWSRQWSRSRRGAGRAAVNPGAVVADVLRDMIGPVLFRPVPIDPETLAWGDGTVRRIAEGIYEERAFGRLPILADALIDAGSENEELIRHCRGAGPHHHGCWAVDHLLVWE